MRQQVARRGGAARVARDQAIAQLSATIARRACVLNREPGA
jgi:hypothetical protein